MALEVLPLGGAEETSWDDPCRERGNLSHQTGRTRKIINLTSKVPWKVGGQIYLSVPRKLLLWSVWLGVAKWRLNILTIETHSTVCSQSFGPLMIWELYQAVYICIYIYHYIYTDIHIMCKHLSELLGGWKTLLNSKHRTQHGNLPQISLGENEQTMFETTT